MPRRSRGRPVTRPAMNIDYSGYEAYLKQQRNRTSGGNVGAGVMVPGAGQSTTGVNVSGGGGEFGSSYFGPTDVSSFAAPRQTAPATGGVSRPADRRIPRDVGGALLGEVPAERSRGEVLAFGGLPTLGFDEPPPWWRLQGRDDAEWRVMSHAQRQQISIALGYARGGTGGVRPPGDGPVRLPALGIDAPPPWYVLRDYSEARWNSLTGTQQREIAATAEISWAAMTAAERLELGISLGYLRPSLGGVGPRPTG